MLEHSQFDEQRCSRLVMGGPMMGFSLTSAEVPIVKTTNCILAPSYQEIPDDEPAQPCIRCGMCAEACPVSLLPQQLFWYSQAEDYERLEAHNLFDCIECGACSYACPSHIPLVQHYRHSKGEIQKARAEKVKSDHARQRFEFHQQRMEQAERDKEAKRAARREAAEKAKATAAAKANSEGASGADSAADIIAAAQARAAAKKVSPEQQQAKFERSIAGAEMRLQMAEDKLAEADDTQTDEQKNILVAAVEAARQKLDQAKGRLADHMKAQSGEQVD
jgi:electron transport complex protein RnfC